jgi:protein SCO1/2
MTTRLLKQMPLGGDVPLLARRTIYAGAAVLALLVGVMLWFAIAQPVQVLPRMRQAPDFTLTDERGAWLSLTELRGRPVLISFGYAGCGAACAELGERMRALRPELSAAGHAPQLLTISVDPRDTPEALRGYAAELGGGDEGWRLLTGAPAELKAIVGEGFRVYYGDAEGGGIELDQRAVLLDANGMQRAEYDLATLESARVLRDLELLAREQTGSATWQRPVYEAAHLFVCYPQ